MALKRDLFTLEERYNACSDHLARGETVDFDKKFLGYNNRAAITSYMFSILVSIPRHPSRFLKELTFLGPSFLHRTWSNFGKSSACWKPRLSWTAESEKMMKNATFECLWQN